ncbi:MFS general substrate transporter [Mytilinidion resinicola]|uniref:MFS general substrate transporter n=1 Tax=Mytilinidion resinicola TaxID=574789 RepID=A0A6A6Y0X2_9PEZI|nr:MFS general substrate transporter [Mytilinidion resinicola]KAF2802456.1 MFS general substrate transporter [Mytilinidion resinicola]
MSRTTSSASSVASKSNEEEAQPASNGVVRDEEAAIPQGEKQLQAGEENRYLVKFKENDPTNPRDWKFAYKVWITIQLGFLALAASTASSIIGPAGNTIAEYASVSREVSVLSVSLYILGFGFGPLCWAPISEIWGRRWSILPAFFILGLFSIGTAVSKNAASIFLTRFFAGLFGSAPVSNVSAALGDIWDPKVRGSAINFYGIMVVGGPTIGPVIGSALLVNPSLGWRWTEYITAIWVFATFALTVFCLPEVYSPVILKWKAQAMRKETGNDAYFHPHEQMKLDANSILTKHLSRPLRMLFTEPMVTCIAFYASFVYGILYLTIEVFPIVFEENRGFAPVVGSLPFLGLLVGIILFGTTINLANEPRYRRISLAAKGRPVPEARLPPMIAGSLIFPTGLFWFGWTAGPEYHWAIPTVAAMFIGGGFNLIFQQCINFLIDTYGLYAASAVSANTFLRSLMAAGLPLAAQPMFHNLGVGPASSILGAVAVAAIPAPLIFWRYGLALRKRSKFAPVLED